jgi:hypothetical protein
MREQRSPEDSELAHGARRRRMVSRLEGFQAGLLRDDRRRRRTVPWGAAASALVAGVALALGGVFGARAPTTGARPAARAEAAPAKLVEGRGVVDFVKRSPARSALASDLFPGDELRTHADGVATLRLALGTSVRLGPSSELELLQPGAPAGKSEAVRLVRGRIEFSVPKQPDGASFSVSAPLAKVVVLGTEFSVSASENGPTTVEVKEGRVLVEHATGSTFLGAGATWTSARPFDPVAAASAASSVSSLDSALVPAVAGLRTLRPLTSSVSSALAASNLAQQNELLMRALSARRSGNDASALAVLDTLLERYPHAAVSEEATVERFRALARLGRRAEARSVARQYLARHPNGFAADEARALALDTRAVENDGP